LSVWLSLLNFFTIKTLKEMATVVTGSVYPPDNSGNWYDDGWGNWTNEPSIIGVVPKGFFDDGWGNLEPIEPNPTLDDKTVKAVQKAKKEGRIAGDSAFVKTMNDILMYGNSFIDLLTRGKVLLNPSTEISYTNIDHAELRKQRENGGLSQNRTVDVPKNAPTNSTFFGIDFSNGANVILVVFGLIGLFKLLFPSTPTTAPTK
jgi:hypothetical protein